MEIDTVLGLQVTRPGDRTAAERVSCSDSVTELVVEAVNQRLVCSLVAVSARCLNWEYVLVEELWVVLPATLALSLLE